MYDDFTHISGEKVEAMLLTPELATVISVWCSGVLVEEIDPFNGNRQPGINVPCKDEVKRASVGDRVIRREDKSFDVIKPNEFVHTYS
jgi:hypothetical protein